MIQDIFEAGLGNRNRSLRSRMIWPDPELESEPASKAPAVFKNFVKNNDFWYYLAG